MYTHFINDTNDGITAEIADYWQWSFFGQSSNSSKLDFCEYNSALICPESKPLCDEAPAPPGLEIENAPLPDGSWSFPLFGVNNCVFEDDGHSNGTFKCPNMTSSAMCLLVKSPNTTQCTGISDYSYTYRDIIVCEF